MSGPGERNTEERRQMAKEGKAMPDGSYPIGNKDELEKAIHAIGRGNASSGAIRAHIIKNARRMGMTSALPEDWNVSASFRFTALNWLTGR
jgi:hypothetical protein